MSRVEYPLVFSPAQFPLNEVPFMVSPGGFHGSVPLVEVPCSGSLVGVPRMVNLEGIKKSGPWTG